jgi:hypothetical protein
MVGFYKGWIDDELAKMQGRMPQRDMNDPYASAQALNPLQPFGEEPPLPDRKPEEETDDTSSDDQDPFKDYWKKKAVAPPKRVIPPPPPPGYNSPWSNRPQQADAGGSNLLGSLASLFDKGENSSLLGSYDGSGVRGGAGADTLGGGSGGDDLFDQNNPLSITHHNYQAPGWFDGPTTGPDMSTPRDPLKVQPDMGLPGNDPYGKDREPYQNSKGETVDPLNPLADPQAASLLGGDPIVGGDSTDYPVGSGGPIDDGKNPGFFSQMFGGSRADKLGTLLMGLGGGMMTAAGDVQGGGTRGIQEGLQGAGTAIDKMNQDEKENAYRMAVLKQKAEADVPEKAQLLKEAGYAPGTTEYKNAMKELIFSGGTDATGSKLADDMGLVRGSKERKDFLMQYALKAQNTSTTNIDMKGESAQTVELAKLNAQDMQSARKSVVQSQQNLRDLQEMREYAENPKVYQGEFANTATRTKAIASMLGIPVEGVAEEQRWRSLTSKMALAARSTADGGGMPGAMSDADRNFLEKMMPGIQNTEAGNRLMIKVMTRMEQFKIGYNTEMYNHMKKPGGSDTVLDHMNEWAAKHDYLKDLQDDPDLVAARSEAGGGTIRRWDDPD